MDFIEKGENSKPPGPPPRCAPGVTIVGQLPIKAGWEMLPLRSSILAEAILDQCQYLALAVIAANSSPSHIVLPLCFRDLNLELLYQGMKKKFCLRISIKKLSAKLNRF